jgi:acyl carrier protein
MPFMQAMKEQPKLIAETGTSYETILKEIFRRLEPHAKSGRAITESTDLNRDLNLDSLAVMELMFELEDRFNISVPMNLLPEVSTVADLAGLVQRIEARRR